MTRWLVLLVVCFSFAVSPSFSWAEGSASSTVSQTLKASEDDSAEEKDDAEEDEPASDDQEDSKADAKQASSEKSEKKSDKSDKKEGKKEEKAEEKAEDKKSKADKGKSTKADKKEKKADIHTVDTEDLKVEVTLDGVFVSREMEEVELRPETWSSFKVLKAVEHGKKVRKGELLVEFDDVKFEQAMTDRSVAQRLGELAMMEAEEELPRVEKNYEMAFEQAKRTFEQEKFEYNRYKETMRPLTEKSIENNLKSAKQYVDNAREELEQLQKMYEADELTEETEEIVLARQRHAVEMAEFYYEYSKLQHDYSLEIQLPRRDVQLEDAMVQAEMVFERAKMVKELGLSKKRYGMEKLREARARSVEEHAKLVADKSLLKLKSPAEGVVYYGKCVNGRWSSANSLKNKLIPFGSVSAPSVVMTIVQLRPLYIVTSASEKNFADLSEGQEVTISPVADSDVKLDGKVELLAKVPNGSNKFDMELDVDADDAPEWLMPGMTCKAKVVVYESEDAVVVPENLVNTDEDNDEIKYVMLVEDEDEDPVRREVELGRKKDKKVEILEGLEKGDKIVKQEKKD